MQCPKLLLKFLVFTAFAAGAFLSAQTQPEPTTPDTSGGHVKIVPAPVDLDSAGKVKEIPVPKSTGIAAPFAIDNGNAAIDTMVKVLSADQMSQHDRDLAADAKSSIEERAGFENFEFDQSGWTFKQLACPALPNHLLLRFSRNEGARDMSMFSAAIPQNGGGRVRIVPIIRKGYSLFSPAPIGAITIAAFNRIRAEENADAPADWLGTGLCYAALAGANPQTGQSQSDLGENGDLPLNIPPTLEVTSDGGAVIHFADFSAKPRPMEWSMTFDRKGKLLKAAHSAASLSGYRTVNAPQTAQGTEPAQKHP